MLDFRLHTFLTLCQTMNYTKAAELLHVTQPTVTQHIQFLEEKYHVRLFEYCAKSLSLTPQGQALQKAVSTLEADSKRITEEIQMLTQKPPVLKFGATLTIGEFILPPVLNDYLRQNPTQDLSMHVENTQVLLSMLNKGFIQFAFIEGHFPKQEYFYRCFSKEAFIAVCSSSHPLVKKAKEQTLSLDEILSYRLILREQGSGSRHIFEVMLQEHNLTLSPSVSYVEIGNIQAIKQLVLDTLGITFIYKTAVNKELEQGLFFEIPIQDCYILREFSFVSLKNSIFETANLNFFEFCQKNISHL